MPMQPPGHFAHIRSGDHARHVWPASDEHIAYMSGGAWDLGTWNPRVVDQVEPEGAFLAPGIEHALMDPRELVLRTVPGVPSREAPSHGEARC
jgi:hypothetical protein